MHKSLFISLIIHIVLHFTLSSSVLANNNCHALFENSVNSQFENSQSTEIKNQHIAKIQHILKKNDFTTSRTLSEYDSYLKLSPLLKKLNSTHRWLDAGAGRARAQLEFLSLMNKNNLPPPELVALSYKKPWFVTSKKNSFQYLEGKKIEDYDISELKKFDLITDFFGPFSYSDNAVQVLNIYIHLLNTSGTLKIHFISQYSSVKTKNNKLDSLQNWIIEQFSSNYGQEIFDVHFEKGTLSVFRKKQKNFELPDLRLAYFYTDLPPLRKYIENNTSD